MYAIVNLAGHQQKVQKDQILLSELTGNAPGSEFTCSDVLMVGEGAGVKIGKPYVSGASVTFKVLAEEKGEKIRGFVYRPKKGFHRGWGHRQRLHRLQVVEIKG
jgi:large subunit ribosomal protein L21